MKHPPTAVGGIPLPYQLTSRRAMKQPPTAVDGIPLPA